MSSYPILKIDRHGNKRWRDEDGLFHREDGPAIEYDNGDKFWYWHGERHREDGPACDYSDGERYWYYHGAFIECKSTEEFLRIIKLKAFW